MIAEFGHFALILALLLAVVQSVFPMWGAGTGNVRLMQMARPAATGQFVFLAISYVCLTYSFLTDDFSVKYVAENSNSLLPRIYKFCAVWGAHEGSMLLWVFIQSAWALAVACFSRSLPAQVSARVLSIMGLISVGFLMFLLFTSNPFKRILPGFPIEGSDLNPLLQDFGMIIHPPMLYMGYVGFSVAFSFAIAALIGGRLDSAWARWTRPWTNIAWAFLSVGIAIGSWWAYYELGWGGWWFWDAVENASFMPWLAGTGLVHSLAVSEKRGLFRSWTLLLAILAFSLSLLGTFLVRSGVLTSVHAFALDSERGVFILAFLAVIIGGSLLLYALRSSTMKGVVQFDWLSREMFILFNNILLLIALAIVFIGTLYPLLYEWMGWGRISVGAPWFNVFFTPVFTVLAILIPIGMVLRWKRNDVRVLLNTVRLPLVLALISGVVFPFVYAGEFSLLVAMVVAVGVWIFAVSWADLWAKSAKSKTRWAGLRKLRGSYYGMLLAHLGIAITVMGIGLESTYNVQQDARLAPGEGITFGKYRFEFVQLSDAKGSNYRGYMADIDIYQNGEFEARLQPEKRRYFARDQWMTESGIDAGFFRDIYVSMGEPLEGDSWGLRLYVKPFIRWIWLGALFIAFGSLLAALDKRYRKVNIVQRSKVKSHIDAIGVTGEQT
jgi:cytochrome c-type biogenesis protein CcmF